MRLLQLIIFLPLLHILIDVFWQNFSTKPKCIHGLLSNHGRVYPVIASLYWSHIRQSSSEVQASVGFPNISGYIVVSLINKSCYYGAGLSGEVGGDPSYYAFGLITKPCESYIYVSSLKSYFGLGTKENIGANWEPRTCILWESSYMEIFFIPDIDISKRRKT